MTDQNPDQPNAVVSLSLTKEDITAKARELCGVHGRYWSVECVCRCKENESALLAIHDAAYEAGKRDENEAKRGAYLERNKLVAWLASIFPSSLDMNVSQQPSAHVSSRRRSDGAQIRKDLPR